jgi:hypothetical protein
MASSLEAAKRAMRQAANRAADQQTARTAPDRLDPFVRAVVTSVTPGGAADGVAALVKVSWGNGEVPVSDYPDSYTPAIGDPVLCVLTADHQLSILHRSIGQP